MTYPLPCPACGHEVSRHNEQGCYHKGANGQMECECPRTTAALYAEECARLAAMNGALVDENVRRMKAHEAEHDALRAGNARPPTSRPDRSALEELRAWRHWWPTAASDPLTLTGAQADELCALLVDAAPLAAPPVAGGAS